MSMQTNDAGNSGFLPQDYGQLVVEPLRSLATAFDPRVSTQITTTSTTFNIPVVRADAGAAFVAEGGDISISDADFDTVAVTPAKIAGITVVTRELAEDSNPAAQQVIADGLAQSIANQVDKALFSHLAAPAPSGLATAGIHEITGWTPTAANFDAIVTAIGYVAAHGGKATSIVLNATDLWTLAKVKEGSTSQRGLLTASVTDPTQFLVEGVPLIGNAQVTAGHAYVVDATQVFTVIRDDTRVEVDKSVYFVSDRVAVKATARIGFGVASLDCNVRLTNVADGS